MMSMSEASGWICKNGHYNEAALTKTVCVYGWNGGMNFPCGAIRDPRDLYESIGGPEVGTPTMGKGQSWSDIAREKNAKKTYDKKRGGYTCFRCSEILATKPWEVVKQESRMTGVEQPGDRLEFFATKEELKWHIKTVHKGKAYADKDSRKFRRDSEKRQKSADKAADLLRGLKDATTRKRD